MRYLSYHLLTRVGSSVTVLLEVCYSVLLNVNSSFGIVTGVTRFIWCKGRVITMVTPHRSYEHLGNNNYLLNLFTDLKVVERW